MILAALGHDLCEDSAIRQLDVVAELGAGVDRRIRGMTEDEDGVAAYVERVATGPEDTRPITLCVGIDKYGGLVANGLVQEHPLRWITVVRRQMEPTFSSAAGIPLRQYLAAGRFLSEKAAQKREHYWALAARPRATSSSASSSRSVDTGTFARWRNPSR